MEVHNLHRRGVTEFEWVFCVKLTNDDNDEFSPYLQLRQSNQPDLNQMKEKAEKELVNINKEQTKLQINEETGEETLDVIKPAGSWRIK